MSDLMRNEGSSGLAAAHLPGPEEADASTMPRYEVSGLTMASAERQSCQRGESPEHKRRPHGATLRGVSADGRSKRVWCDSGVWSSSWAACDRHLTCAVMYHE